MKQINAIIKPFKLDDVREALHEAGFKHLTIVETQGVGSMRSQTEIYRGSQYTAPDAFPKTMVIILVSENEEQQVIELIKKAAKTGKMGDGIIWVTPVESALHIRTDLGLEYRLNSGG